MKLSNNDTFIIENVRISYPHLFQKPIFNGREGKFSAKLLLHRDENKADIEGIKQKMADLLKTHNQSKRLPSEKFCLRNGDDMADEAMSGHFVLSTSNRSGVTVLSRNCEVIEDAQQNPIYAGCYVNAKVSLWWMNNQYGKRINGKLIAVQFVKNGAPLDGHMMSPEQVLQDFTACEDNDGFLSDVLPANDLNERNLKEDIA